MIHFPNMIMIAGSGKNVGKTWLCCRIIKHLSIWHNVTALKTSPHLHTLSTDDRIISQSNEYALIDEQRMTRKDSSRMLQSGAKKSYFFQYQDKGKPEIFEAILPFLPTENPIVCESAGFLRSVMPEVFVYIAGPDSSKQTINNETTSYHFKIKPDEVGNFEVKMFRFEIGKIKVSPA